jgi:ABC-2 type transport system permease protein
MFISWFFMVIFILMSGLFTPIESMPKWVQAITEFNPIKYFVQVMHMVMVMVMVKEASFTDILPKLSKTLIYAFIINGLAVC